MPSRRGHPPPRGQPCVALAQEHSASLGRAGRAGATLCRCQGPRGWGRQAGGRWDREREVSGGEGPGGLREPQTATKGASAPRQGGSGGQWVEVPGARAV